MAEILGMQVDEEYEHQKREDMEEWKNYLATGNAIPQEHVLAWLDEMVRQGKLVAW